MFRPAPFLLGFHSPFNLSHLLLSLYSLLPRIQIDPLRYFIALHRRFEPLIHLPQFQPNEAFANQ
jgi:hypothetical protein